MLFTNVKHVWVEDILFSLEGYDVTFVEKAIQNAFRKIGKVEKVQDHFEKVDGLLIVSLQKISEDSFQENVAWKNFPILQLTMELQTEAFFSKEKSLKVFALIWQDHRFIDLKQNNLNLAIEKNINQMVAKLKMHYDKVKVYPTFYLGPPSASAD